MPMRKIAGFLVLTIATLGSVLYARLREESGNLPDVVHADGSVMLPNGWTVHPAGRPIPIPGDMPLKMGFLPDGKRLLVSTGGWHNQGLAVIDADSEKVLEKDPLPSAWAGMATEGDHVYVSGGLGAVRNLLISDRTERQDDFGGKSSIGSAAGYYSAGVVAKDGVVWVANTEGDSVLMYSGNPRVLTRQMKVGYHPYALALSRDGKRLAVTNWGDSSVSLMDPATLEIRQTIAVGSHPNDLLFAPDGRIFVTNGGANSVSVLHGSQVVETIRTSLSPKDLIGSTPDALAISPDGKTLYVANADNNDVAVIDVSHEQSIVEGFIPTGWYPSALAISPDGRKLFVGTGKGLGFRANAPAKTPYLQTNYTTGAKYDYIGGVLSGAVNVVDVPDGKALKEYTRQVVSDTPRPTPTSRDLLPALRKIKHIVYVIRENRTYDQVLGDIKKGNGDPTLVLFGESVTPNAHLIATDFVLLDNLYCNGEVSEDGHEWSDAAYATDFTERAWVNSYAGRGEPSGDERLSASPAGYLWDLCKKHGVSYVSYGEGGGFAATRTSEPVFQGKSGLRGHVSAEWSALPKRETGGRDYERIDLFIDDLKKAERAGSWPAFTIMALGEDHTSGLSRGAFSPEAAVASNDFAIGKMIDAISHSKFWADTAIFVIEDDAQNGPDHVDAHRTVALVASPYVRRNAVDSTMYTTASMVRTIELILGLPPMNQFDEKAKPMYGSFMAKPDMTPFTVVDPRIALDTRNAAQGALQARSDKLDWSGYDRADPDELNRILWAYRKPGQPMPAPVRSIESIP